MKVIYDFSNYTPGAELLTLTTKLMGPANSTAWKAFSMNGLTERQPVRKLMMFYGLITNRFLTLSEYQQTRRNKHV